MVRKLLERGRSDLLQQQSDGTVRFAPALSNRGDLLATAADLGAEVDVLADAYEHLLRTMNSPAARAPCSATKAWAASTGTWWPSCCWRCRSGCSRPRGERRRPRPAGADRPLRRIRDGLGYHKGPADCGAFPTDPYSHTPGEAARSSRA